MRIFFITYELPPIGGGGGRAAWQIAQKLSGRGHEIMILTSRFASQPRFEEINGLQIHRIPVLRKRPDECPPHELFSFMWRSVAAITSVHDGFRADVTCAFFGIPGGPAAWWLSHRRNVPYVLSLRGSDVPRPELAKRQQLHLFTRPVLKRLYRRASGILSVSDALADAARLLGNDLAIETIPNGVDTIRFQTKSDRSSPTSSPELLFVGRLREFKGVQYVLRALPVIEKLLGRPVRFTIAGEGPYRMKLELLLREIQRQSTCESEVRFVGWLDESEVIRAYEAASLIVLPSRVEGHPNVLLEGMAMGLPSVASDVPGTRAVVTEDVGTLVPPENPRALADAIVEMLSDEAKWQRMSAFARARAETYSWDRVAKRYEAALEGAVSRNKAKTET